jgi:hypothetical protein
MDGTIAVTVAQKPWYQSKTVWLNVITFLSALGVILGGVTMTPRMLEAVGAIVAAANVGLRVWFTGSPISDTAAAISAPK